MFEALSVRVELFPAMTLVGLNEAVTPAGRPLCTLSAIDSALPVAKLVFIVTVVFPPCVTVPVEGVGESEKSFISFAVTLTCAVALWPTGCDAVVPFTEKV